MGNVYKIAVKKPDGKGPYSDYVRKTYRQSV
jgi:hypothetical protein